MTNWTAEIYWQEDPQAAETNGGIVDVLKPTVGTIHRDVATGTTTAILTVEAPSLPQALRAALDLSRGMTDCPVSVRRVVGTEVYKRTTKPER